MSMRRTSFLLGLTLLLCPLTVNADDKPVDTDAVGRVEWRSWTSVRDGYRDQLRFRWALVSETLTSGTISKHVLFEFENGYSGDVSFKMRYRLAHETGPEYHYFTYLVKGGKRSNRSSGGYWEGGSAVEKADLASITIYDFTGKNKVYDKTFSLSQ